MAVAIILASFINQFLIFIADNPMNIGLSNMVLYHYIYMPKGL